MSDVTYMQVNSFIQLKVNKVQQFYTVARILQKFKEYCDIVILI